MNGRLPRIAPYGRAARVLRESLEASCPDRHPGASVPVGLDALSGDPPDSRPRGPPFETGPLPAETVLRAELGRPAARFPCGRPARWCCRRLLPAWENEPPSLQRFLVHSASPPARGRAEFPECEWLRRLPRASTDTLPLAALGPLALLRGPPDSSPPRVAKQFHSS